MILPETSEKRARRRLSLGIMATCHLVDCQGEFEFARTLNNVTARVLDMSERGAQLELTGAWDKQGFLTGLLAKMTGLLQKESEETEKLYKFGPGHVTLAVNLHIPDTNKSIEILGWLMWFWHTSDNVSRLGIRFHEGKNIEIFEHYLGGKAIVLHWA